MGQSILSIAKASCLHVTQSAAPRATVAPRVAASHRAAFPAMPMLAPPRVDLLTESQAEQLRIELLAGHEESTDVPEARDCALW